MMKRTWNEQEIIEGLLDIFRSQRQLDNTFTSRSDLKFSGLDSLTMVRILVAIEEKFGVWLEGDALCPENLQNVETLAHCLQDHLEGETSPYR